MRGENTADWPWEKLAPYGPDITRCLRMLADRYPRDVSPEAVAKDCLSGSRQLWLLFHDDGSFASIMLTKIESNPFTKARFVSLTSFAGEGGFEAAKLLPELEEWARDQGAEELTITGRPGWKRALANEGYVMDMAYFRKDLYPEGAVNG